MKTDYEKWIGNQQTITELIDYSLIRRLAVTLDQPVPLTTDSVPFLWHWIYFQPEIPGELLGLDGHPNIGDFMPPNNGRQRMWAGGSFKFYHPLHINEVATRTSTITRIQEKIGKSGTLLFVMVEHSYQQNGKTVFVEIQNIVYRDPSPPKMTSEAAPKADWSEHHQPNVIQLFRYSAVTFNGHRIHYDYPYATDVEGYDNLVVHGPMMATWALHGFIHAHPDKEISTYSYRGFRPTMLPDDVRIEGRLIDETTAEVWITNDKGVIQKGTIEFS